MIYISKSYVDFICAVALKLVPAGGSMAYLENVLVVANSYNMFDATYATTRYSFVKDIDFNIFALKIHF